MEINSVSFPDQVPISYEFRFFYYEGKCMAYGPYWYMSQSYSLPEAELPEVLKLTDWVAKRLGVSFPAIDAAKTASGEWIIIEVNDAQESGFVGINPLVLFLYLICLNDARLLCNDYRQPGRGVNMMISPKGEVQHGRY